MSQLNVNHEGGSAPARNGEARALATAFFQPSRPCSRSLAETERCRVADLVLAIGQPALAAFSFQQSQASEIGWRMGNEALASLGKTVPEGFRISSLRETTSRVTSRVTL